MYNKVLCYTMISYTKSCIIGKINVLYFIVNNFVVVKIVDLEYNDDKKFSSLILVIV